MSLSHKDCLLSELLIIWVPNIICGVALSFDVALGGTLPPSSGYI